MEISLSHCRSLCTVLVLNVNLLHWFTPTVSLDIKSEKHEIYFKVQIIIKVLIKNEYCKWIFNNLFKENIFKAYTKKTKKKEKIIC